TSTVRNSTRPPYFCTAQSIPTLQRREFRLRSKSSRFVQSLDADAFSKLSGLAQERGITTQELIRAVIIPDWMETESSEPGPYLSRSRAICRFRSYGTRVSSRSA